MEHLEDFAATKPAADCRVFLIGQFAGRITLRSQQLRALNLVDMLLAQMSKARIAVVGGGVAGMTAAAAVVEWTAAASIDVYERASALLPLQRHCKTRYLHPYVIEWPYEDNDSRPGEDALLPLMNWHAAYADEVCIQLLKQWAVIEAKHPGQVNCYLGHRVQDLKWLPSHELAILGKGPRGTFSRSYDFVIVAAGFGVERQTPHPTPYYWENDSVDQLMREFGGAADRRREVLVSGTGDGGLIDVLRGVLSSFRHDTVLNAVLHRVDEGARSHLRRLDASLRALDLADADEVEHYVGEFCSVKVPEIDAYLREQIRGDTRLWLAGKIPHPCLAANANIMHRLLVTRLLETQRDVKDPVLIYRPSGVSLTWKDGYGESVMDGTAIRFDAVFIRHGTDTASQPAMQALARNLGVDLDEVERRASRLAPPSEAFRAHLNHRHRSLLPAGTVQVGQCADTPIGPSELGDLIDLWLSSAPTQALIDRIERAQSQAAAYRFPTALQRAVHARLWIMLSEQHTKLRRPIPAGRAIDEARALLLGLPDSPQKLQAELDIEWLLSIVYKLNSRHSLAVDLCTKSLEGLEVRLAREGSDHHLVQQLTLHEARMRRSLVTYLAEQGEWLAARQSAENADAPVRAGRWKALDATWLCECHLYPQTAMERVLQHEGFQLRRRQMDFWLQAGEMDRALAVFPAFARQYLEAVERHAIDNITRLNFFRLMAGLCARASIGSSADLRDRLLNLARRCAGVSRLAAAGQDLPSPVRIRDAFMVMLDRTRAIDDWEVAASLSEQRALVDAAALELQKVTERRQAPVRLLWKPGMSPGFARTSHAGVFGAVHKPGVGFASVQAAAQHMLAGLVETGEGSDHNGAIALELVRQTAEQLWAADKDASKKVGVLLVLHDEETHITRWYRSGAVDLSLSDRPLEPGSESGAFDGGGSLIARLGVAEGDAATPETIWTCWVDG
ncbi:hypothetical protein SNE35_24105 [Paucibacter sp. R3-3]|uniref:Uncharacterized protein n=1 Tax=Roseateles agri TaxID=3098619 RepID=A0ABU5DMR6_9BURK|nr:hypothetical protein [Paucibacter sp. R3-3]MDY0747608.1 hypothetical protein [Paucibacter sp. R3-3]